MVTIRHLTAWLSSAKQFSNPQKRNNMPLLLIIELMLHIVLLLFGVGVVKGLHWATIAFFVMLATMILVDAIILVSAIRNGKDVRRWDV